DMIAVQRDGCSCSWSRTSRTARDRTSGENLLLVCLLMAPPSQELMEWMPLPAAPGCEKVKDCGFTARGEDNMNDVSIIGVDLAKRVFHAHGARSDGSVAFRKRLSRSQLLTFF